MFSASTVEPDAGEVDVQAERANDAKLQAAMTPLIDVTFLILIFLMVLPFKNLERKLSAVLPKERGITDVIQLIPDEVKVVVKLRPAGGNVSVELLDAPLGTGEPAFAALAGELAALHGRLPDAPGEIDADGDVSHQSVVRTLDSFVKAGYEEIRFRGTSEKGAPRAPGR